MLLLLDGPVFRWAAHYSGPTNRLVLEPPSKEKKNSKIKKKRSSSEMTSFVRGGNGKEVFFSHEKKCFQVLDYDFIVGTFL